MRGRIREDFGARISFGGKAKKTEIPAFVGMTPAEIARTRHNHAVIPAKAESPLLKPTAGALLFRGSLRSHLRMRLVEVSTTSW
jgi:hypothetical protein